MDCTNCTFDKKCRTTEPCKATSFDRETVVSEYANNQEIIQAAASLVDHGRAGTLSRLQEIIVFAIATGLRQGEILNLRWSQVDLFRKTITILEQKNKDHDTLPLNEKALKVLRARAKLRSLQCDNVFFNGTGNPIDARNLLRAFYAAVKRAGIAHLRFHDLRHTFATRLVQRKVDIYAVQKLGRWKSISMVERYGHHYSESLRPGIEALDQEEISTNLTQPKEKGVTNES